MSTYTIYQLETIGETPAQRKQIHTQLLHTGDWGHFLDLREPARVYGCENEEGEADDNAAFLPLSRKFPNVLFILDARDSGNSSLDVCRTFYMDGKGYSVESQMIFPEFDDRKLKVPS